jgi:hypothetical protein
MEPNQFFFDGDWPDSGARSKTEAEVLSYIDSYLSPVRIQREFEIWKDHPTQKRSLAEIYESWALKVYAWAFEYSKTDLLMATAIIRNARLPILLPDGRAIGDDGFQSKIGKVFFEKYFVDLLRRSKSAPGESFDITQALDLIVGSLAIAPNQFLLAEEMLTQLRNEKKLGTPRFAQFGEAARGRLAHSIQLLSHSESLSEVKFLIRAFYLMHSLSGLYKNSELAQYENLSLRRPGRFETMEMLGMNDIPRSWIEQSIGQKQEHRLSETEIRILHSIGQNSDWLDHISFELINDLGLLHSEDIFSIWYSEQDLLYRESVMALAGWKPKETDRALQILAALKMGSAGAAMGTGFAIGGITLLDTVLGYQPLVHSIAGTDPVKFTVAASATVMAALAAVCSQMNPDLRLPRSQKRSLLERSVEDDQ